MDINSMRNIVILKDLPSNLVEEAFIILKKNQKIKRLEYADYNNDKFSDDCERDYESQFVVKEAELLISDYINKTQDIDNCDNIQKNKIERKYRNLKILTCMLSILLIICGFVILCR